MAITKKDDKATTNANAKDRAVAFVNWQVGPIRSNKGFALYNNQYTTQQEKALVELAEKHGGTVTVNATLRIVIAGEKPSYNLDEIEVITED